MEREHDAPLRLHRERVEPGWVDYNGHMNVAYYVLAFDHGTDAFLDHVGMDAPYRASTGGTVFVLARIRHRLRESSLVL